MTYVRDPLLVENYSSARQSLNALSRYGHLANLSQSSGNISSSDYLKWAKRSLNRILKIRLPINGTKTSQYRQAIAQLQKKLNYPATGEINQKLQNALIVRNEEDADYLVWVQRMLNKVVKAALEIDGVKGKNTKAAIRAFQRQYDGQLKGLKLGADGFIGAKTELALILTGGTPPPDNLVSKPPVPPDGKERCGVPKQPSSADLSGLVGLASLQASPQVRPNLCFFQDTYITTDRTHFHCGATRMAKRIRAAQVVSATGNCRLRRGATPFKTGRDILQTLRTVSACLKKKIKRVHIFTHSGSDGVYGTVAIDNLGLYSDDFKISTQERRDGGRQVSDIDTTLLHSSVVFILHGCRMAEGNQNFAKSLFDHLADSLTNPKVFGHDNGGCASRDNSWRLYSKRYPNGVKGNKAIKPYYSTVGCC